MDYQLENLGPERFQDVCQALLVKSFPKVQCFPVAQPDGGRDALVPLMGKGKTSSEFVIYQVKFARDPNNINDPVKWIEKTIKGEQKKIDELIKRGAKEYYLLTNVKGTAHLDNGSIDKVQVLLKNEISISSQCWWRYELARRLDSSYDIKWAYPELLSGPDILRMIIEEGLSDNVERRTNAIRAFLKEQYENDKQVRFKQVDLQNNLLDLFVDLPAKIHATGNAENEMLWKAMHITNNILCRISESDPKYEEKFYEEEKFHGRKYHYKRRVGAASLLLDPEASKQFQYIVLEGGPGQGKSTVVQYICQVHRSKMLNKVCDRESIPNIHKNLSVRLPIKVDLRDFSLWMADKNPFGKDDGVGAKTIESFLATLIHYQSGGQEFDVSDLYAVLKLSSVLLVFDGLDEIADISSRKRVVEEITKGISRLEESSASLQVVVTSRPAAFANSPGLSESVFTYCELGSLTKAIVDEYTRKWFKARALSARDSKEVKRILNSRIDQPHLRELSKNPMQLAILLSLIHTRGSSLPDKRTALYDNYVDLFFNRESEKNEIVREHRDLLIDIHRYLAWLLHAEVEMDMHRGSIDTQRLKSVLKDYLVREQHDETLVEDLFTGMIERVVAIVSRVEGTYEFEVQPLREYFAARHLYDTANYSPAGDEKTGTLPDRFDALAKNAYWLNVTRFYAGCFSKGELPSLVDKLEEINNESDLKYTSVPKVLAITLLSDWVFTQHRRSMNRLISNLFDELGLYYIVSYLGLYRIGDLTGFILPKECGRDTLISRTLDVLKNKPPFDIRDALMAIIRANAGEKECFELWHREVRSVLHEERTLWFYNGLIANVLTQLDDNTLFELMSDEPDNTTRIRYLFQAEQFKYFETDSNRFKMAIDKVLSGESLCYSEFSGGNTVLGDFLCFIDPRSYSSAFQHKQPLSLASISRRYKNRENHPYNRSCNSKEEKNCVDFISLAESHWRNPAKQWSSSLESWDNIVEYGRKCFGDRLVFLQLANISANIKSKTEKGSDCPDLLNKDTSLCQRFRYARLKTTNIKWWSEQLDNISSEYDEQVVLIPLLTWAGKNVIDNIIDRLDSILGKISNDSWECIRRSLQRTYPYIDNKNIKFNVNNYKVSLSSRLLNSLSLRLHRNIRMEFYDKYSKKMDFSDNSVRKMYLETATWDPENWNKAISFLAKGHNKKSYAHLYLGHAFIRKNQIEGMSLKLARKIVTNPKKYPILFVHIAEEKWKESIYGQQKSVFEISKDNNWWPDD